MAETFENTTGTFVGELACGCRIELMECGCCRNLAHRCREAERLWDRTELPFRMGLATGQWERYDRAARAYRAHFRKEES